MPRKVRTYDDPARAGGPKVMVRVPRWLAQWASNLAVDVDPDELPDVDVTRIEPSRSNVITQAIIYGMQRLDPAGEYSQFGMGRTPRENPWGCPVCYQDLPNEPLGPGGLYVDPDDA